MALTQEQIEKVKELLDHEDFSFTIQAVELVETLIDNEMDFRSFITDLTGQEMERNPSLSSLQKKIGSYVALWMICTLAQWNTEIQQITELPQLYLSSLPDNIGNLINLTVLDFQHNELKTLPDSIGTLTNLTYLELYDNQLTTLPESIGNLTNLTVLYLGGNAFTILPDSIGNLNNLTELV